MTLSKYYKTKHWMNFRNKLLNDFDCKCEICGRRRWTIYKKSTHKHNVGDRKRLLKFNVHHKNYNNAFHERREDVMTLCQHCHTYGHILERASRLNKNVYLDIYNLYKKTTKWEFKITLNIK